MKKFWIFFSLTWAALIINSSFFKSENIDKGISWFENQDKVGHFVFCAIFSWCLIKSFSQEIFLNHPIMSLIYMYIISFKLLLTGFNLSKNIVSIILKFFSKLANSKMEFYLLVILNFKITIVTLLKKICH